MVAVGIAGYVETPYGIKRTHLVWANHIAESMKRRMYEQVPEKIEAFAKFETNAAAHPELLKNEVD